MRKNLSYFMRLKYNVILNKQNNSYSLFIPEISLIVEGKTLADAYKKLENDKELYFKRVIELNAKDTVKEPVAIVLRKKLFVDMMSFFSKGLIIIICMFVIFTFMLQSLPGITQKIGNSVVQKISIEIIKMDNYSAEDKERIMEKIRERLQVIKPLVDEFRILLQDDNKSVKKNSNSITTETVGN